MFFWIKTFSHKLLQGLHTWTTVSSDLGVGEALFAIGEQITHMNNVIKELISLEVIFM